MAKATASRTAQSRISSPIIRSMTGYGVAAAENKFVRIEVEVKTVNSRHLDVIFRLPRKYAEFETQLRTIAAAAIERGRVEIAATRTAKTEQPIDIQFKREAFNALLKTYKTVGAELGCTKEEIRGAVLSQLLGRGDILEMNDGTPDVSQEGKLLVQALQKSLEVLNAVRAREGQLMAQDMEKRLRTLQTIRITVVKQVAQRPEQIRDRLLNSLNRLAADFPLDPARLHTEAAILADRLDVTEELVRLDSHLEHFQSLLAAPPVGKKLDFLIQELVREFNTIGSKAQDAGIQTHVIEAKSELEKIREQVQNLE